MRGALILAAAMALFGQTPVDPARTLARARDKFLDSTQRLPNYTCVQTVNREYFRPAKPRLPRPSCDQMIEERRRNSPARKLEATDRLRLDVKVSDGTEIGSWAGAGPFDSRGVFDLIGGGPFGTGPFGTLLWDIFASGGARFQYVGEDRASGATLFEYRFEVPSDASHSYIKAGAGWVATAYDGSVWIDPGSLDPMRLSVRSGELPPETGGCELATTVDYQRLRIGTRDFLVPRQSAFHVLMRDNAETEVRTSYSSCREYVGEATLHFGEDVSLPAAQEPKAARVSLPGDLSVSLAFASPIDTDTAAAGDVVVATVLDPVRAPRSKQVLIPAGATVRGRITKMQHWLSSPAHFWIAILLETVEINGVPSPFHAKREGSEGGPAIFLPLAGQPPNVACFVFFSSASRHVVPRGYRSNWTTLAPPSRR